MEAEVYVGSIEHLDFEPEEEEEEEKSHYCHPTDPNKSWCEEQSWSDTKFSGPTARGGTSPEEITCVGCLHEYIAKGPKWWWSVHNAWFQSTCTTGGHNCGA